MIKFCFYIFLLFLDDSIIATHLPAEDSEVM